MTTEKSPTFLLSNITSLGTIPLHSDPALRDNVLYVDNTAIEVITTCPWKAYVKLLLKRRSAEPAPSLLFGSHIHQCMDYRYKQLALGREPDISYQLELLEELWNGRPLGHPKGELSPQGTGEDWRSLGMAQELIRKYHLQYDTINENFDVWLQPNGSPAVELSFAIKLGEVDGVVIIYMGKIDVIVVEQVGARAKFIMDHKTTSMMGDGFWRDASMSPQQRGYCYAVREVFGEEPNGYIINALGTRKPTKTGTSLEFQRRTFYTRYPESQLDEWKENCLAQCRTFLSYCKQNFFPRHHAMHCEAKFGKCEFYEVCEMPRKDRDVKLMGSEYKVNDWSPLKQAT